MSEQSDWETEAINPTTGILATKRDWEAENKMEIEQKEYDLKTALEDERLRVLSGRNNPCLDLPEMPNMIDMPKICHDPRWPNLCLIPPRLPDTIGPLPGMKHPERENVNQPILDVMDKEEKKGCPEREPADIPNDGDNGNYYDIWVSNKDGKRVMVRCLDTIEALNMTFSEGEAFKAIWRKAAARLGKGKSDNNPVYDAKKIRFYGESIERMALKEANETKIW